MPDFEGIDVFDIAEGLNVLAHDFGLYALGSRLHDAGFRASPLRDSLDTIDGDGRDVYDSLAPMALESDPYSVPDWAEPLLARIEDYA